MKKHIFSVLFMVIITAFFSGLVTVVMQLNEETIESNRLFKFRSAVLEVLDISVSHEKDRGDALVRVYDSRIRELRLEGQTIYIGYDQNGVDIQGYAFPVEGSGLWGSISGLAAVDAEASILKRVVFLQHSETPGLGGRITEDWFLEQFAGLTLQSASADGKFFTMRTSGQADAPGRIDAITGATITSSAVETFLNSDIQDFLRDIRPRLLERE